MHLKSPPSSPRGRRGQDLLAADASARDASGNVKPKASARFCERRSRRSSKPKASRSSCVTSTRATRSAAARRTARMRCLRSPRATPSTPRRTVRLAVVIGFCTSVHRRPNRTPRHAHQTTRPPAVGGVLSSPRLGSRSGSHKFTLQRKAVRQLVRDNPRPCIEDRKRATCFTEHGGWMALLAGKLPNDWVGWKLGDLIGQPAGGRSL